VNFLLVLIELFSLDVTGEALRAKIHRSAILEGKQLFCVIEPLWGVRGNVRWSSRAHWKASGRLPISVNWTFFR